MEFQGLTFRSIPKETDSNAIRTIVISTGVFRSDEVDVAVELIEERLRRGSASGYYFVFAEQAGKVVGYTCFGPIACTISSFDLYWIAVLKEYHGRKIGSGLMAETENQITAMGGKQVYIETSSRSDYLSTRSFYLHHHYRIEATIRNFYDTGDDKIIYSRELGSA